MSADTITPWWTEPDGAVVAARLEALLGVAPKAFRAVTGGYTPVRRAIAELEDGTAVFVKVATHPKTVDALRAEHQIYTHLQAPFMPVFRVYDEAGGPPLLVLEDLSDAHWPPPWTPDQVQAVVAMLDQVARTPVPPNVPRLRETMPAVGGWETVAADPAPFLSLGLVSPAWLDAALPRLCAAEAAARLEGEDFVHVDVRSDNLCLSARGPILVDWNMACRGNRLADLAFWLPSLQAEGGPSPEAILPGQPELAAWVAGFFAARAGEPDIPYAPRVRYIQRVQLSTALPWVIRALALPPADGERADRGATAG